MNQYHNYYNGSYSVQFKHGLLCPPSLYFSDHIMLDRIILFTCPSDLQLNHLKTKFWNNYQTKYFLQTVKVFMYTGYIEIIAGTLMSIWSLVIVLQIILNFRSLSA